MGLNAVVVFVSLVLVVGLMDSSSVAQSPSKAPAESPKSSHSKRSHAPAPATTPAKGSPAPAVSSPSTANPPGAASPESGAPTGSSVPSSSGGESPSEAPSGRVPQSSARATAKLEKIAIFGAALVGGAAFLL